MTSSSSTATALAQERDSPHLRTPSPSKDPDAGLRGLGHYERRLPAWRFHLRQWLIPVVRWETPYLAAVQAACRTPMLDSYFAMTANLGTHTFFMAALPICFWCGYPDAGVALVHMLASGVYVSGFVKDMVCLPRPLSPPLQRITMSGSAALEYGFPSTHTTNAVSVAMFCLYRLIQGRESYSDPVYFFLCVLCYFYALSIMLGRMYCGMHGFFDVAAGLVLGALIGLVRIVYGPALDTWILEATWRNVFSVIMVLLAAVRIHPEPADNCPCYDDSVAFIGVVMGVSLGTWQQSVTVTPPLDLDRPLHKMYMFENHHLLYPAARTVLGILIVFVWRASMKPILLGCLPPIFRFVDHWGFRIPRRYFLQSRDYKTVPPLRKDDNVIPPASEIPAMVSNLTQRRKRTVSVGPQSEADAREYIHAREQRRRNSRSSVKERPSLSSISGDLPTPNEPTALETPAFAPGPTASSAEATSYLDARKIPLSTQQLGTPSTPLLQVHPPDPNLLTPPPSDNGTSGSDSGREDEKNDREMFSALEKPRIRYDVEVITKLVVYAGIAWLATRGNPVLFGYLGLT